ncbi:putative symporter YjmB [Oxobacter pfennigii]|uniref:Putative symporter YjmB n=1 Tax=Oxobacter pfennigii TaxID=36849 RepID=A0A0P8WDU4_9CLOT|nr:MFS transporter [Oxobacter pfennigii]KPU46202.1 putative symporter YjmB [Oxobacter pfennigii]
MKKPLSKTIQWFYGISDFGFSIMTGGMEVTYLMFFMTNVAKFSLVSIGIATTVSAIVDALMQPVYGGIITGTKPMKWGRNRSWLVFMPVLVVITFITMFTSIGPKEVGVVIVAASLCLTNAARTFPWLAHVNLITVLASGPDERAKLASVRGTWAAAGGIVSSYVALPLIMFFSAALKDEVIGYTIVAGIVSIFYAVTTWFTFAFTKGYEETGDSAVQTKAQKVTVMDMLRSAAGNPPLIVLLIADFFKYMSGFVSSAAAAYYFTYILKDMALMPLYLFLGAVMLTIGAACAGYAAKKLSTKISAVLGIIGMGLAFTIGFFVARNMYAFFACILVARFCGGLVNTAVIALYTDCIVYSEWKTGKNTSPFIMASMTFALKLSYIARGTLVPAVLAMVGFSAAISPEQATETLKNGILAAFLLIPGVALLLSGSLIYIGYKLTRDKVQELQAEIDARKAAAQA